MTKLRDKAEKETGHVKDALLNITAETEEMKKRAKLLHDKGWKYAMIDVVTCGSASVQTMREVLGDYKMAIHAHRAMHASFDRNEKHGITMQFLAKTMKAIGVDQIHSGTASGKLIGDKDEIRAIASVLRDKNVARRDNMILDQDWGDMKRAFPVSSGGLHPGLIPSVLDIYGKDVVLLVSGGIHGHPEGTHAGAKAVMQALEAGEKNISLEDYSKSNRELRQALEKWGRLKPR